MDIAPIHTTPSVVTREDSIDASSIVAESPKVFQGPITRNRAKQIQNQVNANLSIISNINDAAIFPISSSFTVLRCIEEELMTKDIEEGQRSCWSLICMQTSWSNVAGHIEEMLHELC